MTRRFGGTQYVRVVRDAATKLSKGTAFVCFKLAASAEKCLQRQASEAVVVLGQAVTLSAATDKESADTNAKERREAAHQKEASRRNMHLARLGLVLAGDDGYEALPLAERRKREDAWKQKKRSNFLVSDCRLSVRNLPPAVDETGCATSRLGGGARAASGSAKVKQVKIIRDEGRLDQHGLPRSRGFGFVQFEQHEHALAALHHLSDNEGALGGGEKRRLLVEFAVDDVRKLRILEAKMNRGAGGGKGEGRGAAAGGRGGGGEGRGKGGGKGGGKGSADADDAAAAPRRGQGGKAVARCPARATARRTARRRRSSSRRSSSSPPPPPRRRHSASRGGNDETKRGGDLRGGDRVKQAAGECLLRTRAHAEGRGAARAAACAVAQGRRRRWRRRRRRGSGREEEALRERRARRRARGGRRGERRRREEAPRGTRLGGRGTLRGAREAV